MGEGGGAKLGAIFTILLTAAATAGIVVWWEKQMQKARLRILLAGAKNENERIASKAVALYYGMDVTEGATCKTPPSPLYYRRRLERSWF